MKSLLVFLPDRLQKEASGYLFGKVIYDENTDVTKFYVIGVQKVDDMYKNIIGYYSDKEEIKTVQPTEYSEWIHICNTSLTKSTNDYKIKSTVINNKSLSLGVHTVILIYDQIALRGTQLFDNNTSGNHFYELMQLLQSKEIDNQLRKKGKFTRFKEYLLVCHMLLYLYPIIFLSKITSKFSYVLKYSSLGLHLSARLENIKWMLSSIIDKKGFTLKTVNYACALVIDILLGLAVLQLLLNYVVHTTPSLILLSNAEKVVESLKDLMEWLMGAPAGLKLNCALNNMLGKFFLYNIHLWWKFLIFTKPLMDLAFDILMLFGKLGITFQIAIAADLLSVVSFHTYCIYVYAARLFNIQLKGITALFRLFLGKKKNPLRQRVDSCQYQPDQLFVGTLLFTILLFLMPTTWVYYTVFTTLRLLSISFSGFLTRLMFYLEVMPIYTFANWVLHSNSTRSVVNIQLHSERSEGSITLTMLMSAASWGQTWEKCIPATVVPHAPIEWNKIVNSIIWGELLYPL